MRPERSGTAFSWLSRLAAGGALLLCASSLALSQPTEAGVIRGTVVDQEGQVIGGARVVMTSLGTALARFEVETESDGRYAQTGLASGFYTVTAEKDELGSEVFRIRVRSGRTVDVNFALEPGRRVATWLSDVAGREELSRVFAAGVAANREGDFETAAERFTRTVELSSTCIECYFNLAVAYKELDRFAEAESAFRQAIDIKPDYAAAYYGLATIYVQLDRVEDAAAARGEANRIALEGLAAGRAQAEDAVSRGITFLEAGNVADAHRRFEEAVRNDHNYGPAYYWLGLSFLRQDRPDEAAREFTRYLGIEPNGEFSAETRQHLDTIGR